MTENIKVCPECHAEYFGHVESCAECEVGLVSPTDSVPDEAMHAGETGGEGAGNVLIEQGGVGTISELAEALKAAGIPFQAGEMEGASEESCSSGSCAPEKVYGLAVPASSKDAAMAALDEYWESMDPEMKTANERMLKGHCPACGHDARGSAECPECGLNLVGDGSKPPGGCC